jgi:hypothetical protein
MKRLLSLLVLISALGFGVVGCGEDPVDAGLDSGDTRPDGQPTVRKTTVEHLLGDPRNWNEGPVIVRGEAYPRERGFLLVNEGASIWVAAPTGAPAVESGEQVRVRGELERLTPENVEQVTQALRIDREPGIREEPRQVIAATPADVGKPFLVLRNLETAGGADAATGAIGNGLPDPAGEGTDRDELAPIGSTIRADGLAYTPQTSRLLNPHIKPDEALVGGRTPPPDESWFGAFVRVCNESGVPQRSSDDLALVDAFGKRIEPTELPEGNPFAYEPEVLALRSASPRAGPRPTG